jgi:hypothetical protein
VLAVLIPPFGPIDMAAATIALQYMHVSFMPALGIGMALTTQVGNSIGAGQPEVAVERVRLALRVIVAWMGFMGLVFLVAGRPLALAWTQFESGRDRGARERHREGADLVRDLAGLRCALHHVQLRAPRRGGHARADDPVRRLLLGDFHHGWLVDQPFRAPARRAGDLVRRRCLHHGAGAAPAPEIPARCLAVDPALSAA